MTIHALRDSLLAIVEKKEALVTAKKASLCQDEPTERKICNIRLQVLGLGRQFVKFSHMHAERRPETRHMLPSVYEQYLMLPQEPDRYDTLPPERQKTFGMCINIVLWMTDTFLRPWEAKLRLAEETDNAEDVLSLKVRIQTLSELLNAFRSFYQEQRLDAANICAATAYESKCFTVCHRNATCRVTAIEKEEPVHGTEE